MNVIVTGTPCERETQMKTFTIDADNNITAIEHRERAGNGATAVEPFGSEAEFAELVKGWPAARLISIWNSLPGVTAVKRFKSSKAGVSRIWQRIEMLDRPEKERKPPATAKASARKQGRTANRGKSAAKAVRGSKAAPKAQSAGTAREGSKASQVVSMLQRKNGATLAEIMEATGWQQHTVRGFMAGAMKKAGHAVESFKAQDGARTYRLPA